MYFAIRVVNPSTVSTANPSGLVAGTYTEWKGIVSGTTITNLTLQNGSDQVYTAGTNTQVFIPVTAPRENSLVDWGLVQHNQDGSHGAVTATSIDTTADSAIKDHGTPLSTIRSEITSNFIASGGVIAISAGLVGTFSNMTFYSAGVRYQKTSVPNKTYTASQDTYVDADPASSGSVVYTPVTNGAAAPPLTSGYVRVAVVVTNGSAITSISQTGRQNAVQTYPTSSVAPFDWWQELGRVTLTVAGNTITLASFTPKTYLRIIVRTLNSGGAGTAGMRFNNDAGNNYAIRYSLNGAADTTSVSQPQLPGGTGTSGGQSDKIAEVINIAGNEKIAYIQEIHSSTAGAATAPDRFEIAAKWANTTSQINRIDIINGGTGNFGIGSEIIVLGHD